MSDDRSNDANMGAPAPPQALSSAPGENATAANAPTYAPGSDVSSATGQTMNAPAPGPQKPSLWKSVLSGALEGLAGSGGATSFGGGLGAGAAGQMKAQVQQKAQALEQQRANMQQEQAASTIKFQSAQAGSLIAQAQVNAESLSEMPQKAQDAHLQVQESVLKDRLANGWTVASKADDTHDSVKSAVEGFSAAQNGLPEDVSYLQVGNEHIALMPPNAAAKLKVINQGRVLQNMPELTAQDVAAFKPAQIHQLMEKSDTWLKGGNSPKSAQEANGTYLQYKSVSDAMAKNPNADPDALKQAQNLTASAKVKYDGMLAADKEKAAAAAAQRAAAKSADANPEWRPKVTADEKKKAELAENIAFNANEVNTILAKRPDLVGAIAGRATNAQQLIGNNDKDISAIGNHIHNIAMANSGVHGFRSQEGVVETEKNLLNNFRNGATAVKGALDANVGSVQTFIDNARPDNFRTHSTQGGAGAHYGGGSTAAAPKQNKHSDLGFVPQ